MDDVEYFGESNSLLNLRVSSVEELYSTVSTQVYSRVKPSPPAPPQAASGWGGEQKRCGSAFTS
jgi:hypothetical protein